MTQDEFKTMPESYQVGKSKKKKPQYSKYIVAFIIALNVFFTLGVLYVFIRTGNEPSTLVGAFFGFTTVELWSLAGIKKKKIEKENDYND